MKTLFVCNANVSRSQVAAVLYKKYSGMESDSAGTNVSPEREGAVIPPDASVAFMANEGLDISKNTRKGITPEMVEKFDKIIVMADKNVPDYLQNNEKVEFWDIQDTRNESDDVYKRVISEIKQKIIELMEKNNIKMLEIKKGNENIRLPENINKIK
ncbi:MAG: low molecular weight phosphatase family protein [bacterium]